MSRKLAKDPYLLLIKIITNIIPSSKKKEKLMEEGSSERLHELYIKQFSSLILLSLQN
jgi:hypothetical protein